MAFINLSIEELKINPMTMIGEEWWLITAGNKINGYNTMTASWGHLGSIWGRPGQKTFKGLPTASVYVRPQRYTKEFMEREDIFTLSVFDQSYKKALAYLGSHTGREENKISTAGLTPLFDHETTFFEEAKMVFVCRKIYHAPLLEQGFVDKSLIENNYKDRDFHEMYIGEILKILVRDEMD